MTLPLPDPLIVVPRGNIGDDVANPEGVQRNFEFFARQFPVAAQNLAQIPQVRVFHSVAQSIATGGSGTFLAFDSERWDNAGMHDPVTNNSRLTCQVPGLYWLSGQAEFATSGTGSRQLAIRANGNTFIAATSVPGVSTLGTDMEVVTQYRLNVGDYVELRAFQDSGGALNVSSSPNYSAEFMACFLSP